MVYGEYVFTAIFDGNENYTYTTAAEKTFNVNKINSKFNISASNILVGENEIITVNIDRNVTGDIIININGTRYYESINNGKVILNVSGLKFGTYNVIAEYKGDSKYLPGTNTTSFDVNKNPVGEIKVNSNPVRNNKTVVSVIVPVEDATGYVIITVNGQKYSAKLLDGKTTIEVDNLTDIENPFEIVYVGDDKYLSNRSEGVIINQGIFIESSVNVSVADIMVDDKADIIVQVLDDATGFVLIVIDNKTSFKLPIIDAGVEYAVAGLKAGKHNVSVTYLGDDKYYTSTNSTVFNVIRYDNSIEVSAVDGVAGIPSIIKVISSAVDASGDVIISVDGVNYTSVMSDGIAVFNITFDKAGVFDIVADYTGNDYYSNATAMTSFSLDYNNMFLNVTALDVFVGEDAFVIVNVPLDASGNITLKIINNIQSFTTGIVDGIASFSIANLTIGTYSLSVSYSGDAKYRPVLNDDVEFNVVKKDVSPISDNKTNVEVISGDNGTSIVVSLPENATGNVTVLIDGENITVPVVNGSAVVNIGNLTNQTNNISIIYNGDDEYAGFNESAVVSNDGVKFHPVLTVSAEDSISVGDVALITVNLPVDATGEVVLNISGNFYTMNVSKGVALFNITGLNNGTQTIVAGYSGDKKYLAAVNVSSINVNKVESLINISAGDINVGETAVITVNVPADASGIVKITVNNIEYSATISNAQAVFGIDALMEGNYSINALYTGDGNYLPVISNASFSVSRNNISPVGGNKSGISVDKVGNSTIVSVNVPADAVGSVNITVDGVTYSDIPVVNGTAAIVLDNVGDNANVSVSYSGDSKYGGFSQDAVIGIDGVRLNTPIIVKTDKDSYVAGDKVNIIVSAPGDATGNITVSVNGVVVSVVEGLSIVEYTVPSGGEFSVDVYYRGDNKYAPAFNSFKFSAVKSNSTININVDNTPFDENITIVVDVNSDATGNITLVFNSDRYIANITDGKAVFVLPNPGIGSYYVSAFYDGDLKYNANETGAGFNVDLKVVCHDIVWGEDLVVCVIAPVGSQGLVTVVCEDMTFVVVVNDTVMNFTFTDLMPGIHPVSVSYDNLYGYQSSVVCNVNVDRLSSDMTVSVSNITVGDVLNITVNVSSIGDVNGSVVYVLLDGVNYTGVVVNDSAVISIPSLGAGHYNISVVYNGTTFVKSNICNITFTISDIPVNIVGGKNINVFYLQGAVYSVRLLDDMGRPVSGAVVVFSVGGKNYSVISDVNGWASLKVNLKPGKYKITASYGDKSVSNNVGVKSILNVKKTTVVKKSKRSTVIEITVKGHNVKQTAKVKFTYNGKNKIKVKFGKEMKKQSVVVKFKGKSYKVKVNNRGVGTLKLAKKVSKKLKKGKKYTAKVTYIGSKLYKKVKVTVKFNGKKYNVKTNKQGVAKFKVTKKMVKNMKKGKKVKYTVTYKADKLTRYVKIK